MKKFLFLMLSAAVAVSASAGIGTKISKQAANIDKNAKKVERVTRGDGYVAPSTPITFRGWDKQFSHVMRSDAAITWILSMKHALMSFRPSITMVTATTGSILTIQLQKSR